jgi:RimJ/RimL family protein N-acetyltransferase
MGAVFQLLRRTIKLNYLMFSVIMAKSRSIKRITFNTESDNLAIRKLAENMGFKLTRIVYEKEL